MALRRSFCLALPKPLFELHPRPHFDMPGGGPGNLGGQVQRDVQVLAIEDLEPPELLLSVNERPVRDDPVAVANTHHRGRVRRLERGAPYLRGDLCRFLAERLPGHQIFGRRRLVALLVEEQKHVFHVVLLRLADSTRVLSRTLDEQASLERTPWSWQPHRMS